MEQEVFIPAYRKQINFLESLYPLISGIQFLEHRSKIKIRNRIP